MSTDRLPVPRPIEVIEVRPDLHYANQFADALISMFVTRYIGGRALRKMAEMVGYDIDPKQARKIMGYVSTLHFVSARFYRPPAGKGKTYDEWSKNIAEQGVHVAKTVTGLVKQKWSSPA